MIIRFVMEVEVEGNADIAQQIVKSDIEQLNDGRYPIGIRTSRTGHTTNGDIGTTTIRYRGLPASLETLP